MVLVKKIEPLDDVVMFYLGLTEYIRMGMVKIKNRNER